MNISKKLKTNVEYLKKKLRSDDVEFLDITVKDVPVTLIFLKDVADKEALGELVLKPLSNMTAAPEKNSLENLFLSPEKTVVKNMEELVSQIVLGDTAFLCEGLDFSYTFGLKKFEKRPISEPPTSAVIKGPREGFVESLPVNISLMRRRIKSPDLIFENLTVGRYSKTPVSLCYIDGIAKKSLVNSLKKKLQSISIDAVLDSSYVEKFLGEHKTSIFKQVGNTEKPDILSAKILEGRVAIFVDGSPIVLTVPYLLMEDFQSPSDYYNSSYSATIARVLRLLSVSISLLLPSLFVAAELFHLQLIPLSFLLTIVNSIKGIPLSPSYEMFFTLLIFEILNEASVRMPKYVGMVVSIVGGLVLGETAVNAGIISAPTLMIVAFSGICLFTVPELEQILSLIRLVLLIIGGSFGGYGIIMAICFIAIYLVSFENYKTPLMAPFSPLVTPDLKDGIYKGFLIEQRKRPLSLKNANVRRMGQNGKRS
ncbi:MAG: spore germination protein [Clostridiales bacterium]|nr:spore germination protein [Clostridiales bacterium]